MDDIDKAIKFLRSHFELGIYTKKSEEIIALLKRGKKSREIVKSFSAMWKELKDCHGFWHLVDKGKMYSRLATLLEKLEQKFFPKGGI